jgi:hypothetical protein
MTEIILQFICNLMLTASICIILFDIYKLRKSFLETLYDHNLRINQLNINILTLSTKFDHLKTLSNREVK